MIIARIIDAYWWGQLALGSYGHLPYRYHQRPARNRPAPPDPIFSKLRTWDTQLEATGT